MDKIALNKEGGFDIAVLTQDRTGEALMVEDPSCPEKDINGRLFLVSNASNKQLIPNNVAENTSASKKPKRTINRKQVFEGDAFTHDGETYNVNSAKSGLYVEILSAIIKQFQISVTKWTRVFVLRFDLHTNIITKDNKIMTAFRKRLVQKLKREYGFKEVGFCWVREQERAKAQHYHWVLFLDGDLIRHSKRINEIVRQLWEGTANNNYVPIVKNPFYFVDNEQLAQEAIYRVSYLAKTRGKGYRDNQVKDYQCSRMKML